MIGLADTYRESGQAQQAVHDTGSTSLSIANCKSAKTNNQNRKEDYEPQIRRTHQEPGSIDHARSALKHFGRGVAGAILAAFGLSNRAETAPQWCDPSTNYCCCRGCKS
jgi:hypothetical protein